VSPSRTLILLSVVVAALAAAAAFAGLFANGVGPDAGTSLRGDVVPLFGRGVYRFDTSFTGAGFRAQDVVTLVLAVPALLVATFAYARRRLGGALLLGGVLAYFLYAFGSLTLSAAYNDVFLVYVATFSASLFALVLAFGASEGAIPPSVDLPRGGPGTLLIVSGVGTLLIWLQPVVAARMAGAVPPHLDIYTTPVTVALDVAIVAPCAIVAGVLILRRNATGYRMAFPLFGIIAFLMPVIPLATWLQAREGVLFTTGEIVGPVVSFILMGALSVWAAVAVLRALRRPPAA
jgi:hypothetical protein